LIIEGKKRLTTQKWWNLKENLKDILSIITLKPWGKSVRFQEDLHIIYIKIKITRAVS